MVCYTDDLINDTGVYLTDLTNVNGTYTHNGSTYTKGNFIRSNAGLNYYQVCKE